jgi:hypothetical protein
VIPSWFLYTSGFALVVLGALQIQARPRRRGASLAERFVNLGTFWSLLCITVGTVLVLMALGWIESPAGRAPPPPPRRGAHGRSGG